MFTIGSLCSISSEYLDFNKDEEPNNEKITIIEPSAGPSVAVRQSSRSSSSTTLSTLTDTSCDSHVSQHASKKVKRRSKYQSKLRNNNTDDTEFTTVGNTPSKKNQSKVSTNRKKSPSILTIYNQATTAPFSQLIDSDESDFYPNEQYGRTVTIGHQDSKQYNRELHSLLKQSLHDRHKHSKHTCVMLSENEEVQTAGENIRRSKNKVEHWEYETPLSEKWCINPPEDPKMALISLLVETHRRIISSTEQPNSDFRNTIDYGLSSLHTQINDVDPECSGCAWPFINPEDNPENCKGRIDNRKYYFLTAGSEGCDWEDQDFTAPLKYLAQRRKKLKALIIMMKEELFYITERFLDLSKNFRHKIARDSRLRKRFEAVGLDLVYKRAYLDNMHHLYHRVKKLYEAYLPLCSEA